MESFIVYTKFRGDSAYRATDIERGVQVSKAIYASLLHDTPDLRGKLQRLADRNAASGLRIQLRSGGGGVVFETAAN